MDTRISEGLPKNHLDTLKKRAPKKGIYSKHQDLAFQIASDFHDIKNIGIYMRICKRFSDLFVRRIWALTNEIGPSNRARYFTVVIYREAKR